MLSELDNKEWKLNLKFNYWILVILELKGDNLWYIIINIYLYHNFYSFGSKTLKIIYCLIYIILYIKHSHQVLCLRFAPLTRYKVLTHFLTCWFKIFYFFLELRCACSAKENQKISNVFFYQNLLDFPMQVWVFHQLANIDK